MVDSVFEAKRRRPDGAVTDSALAWGVETAMRLARGFADVGEHDQLVWDWDDDQEAHVIANPPDDAEYVVEQRHLHFTADGAPDVDSGEAFTEALTTPVGEAGAAGVDDYAIGRRLSIAGEYVEAHGWEAAVDTDFGEAGDG